MSIFNLFKEPSLKGIMENYWGGILVLITVTLFTLASKKVRSKIFPFLYNHLGPRVTNYLKIIFNFLFNPLFRLIAIWGLLFFIVIGEHVFILAITIFILSATFLLKEREIKLFTPSAIFSTGFPSKTIFADDWDIKTGTPIIDKTFGKPSPDLELKYDPTQATCSLIFKKDIDRTNGVIELDFNLERDGILNILFFASPEQHKWYMSRFDSRIGFSDGFIIKDQGPGNNWREFVMSGTNTPARDWFRARVEFDEKEVKMYRDNVLIAGFENPQLFGSKIGMFNEINDVHIDNFLISEKPYPSKTKN